LHRGGRIGVGRWLHVPTLGRDIYGESVMSSEFHLEIERAVGPFCAPDLSCYVDIMAPTEGRRFILLSHSFRRGRRES